MHSGTFSPSGKKEQIGTVRASNPLINDGLKKITSIREEIDRRESINFDNLLTLSMMNVT